MKLYTLQGKWTMYVLKVVASFIQFMTVVEFTTIRIKGSVHNLVVFVWV